MGNQTSGLSGDHVAVFGVRVHAQQATRYQAFAAKPTHFNAFF